MAVLWRRRQQGKWHEVRSAGASRRLYTDGVFHSQYNPNQLVGGHVWDLLMLPAFFHEPQQIRRILILGSGGGAVMRQFEALLAPALITGVDINPLHLQVARRFFAVRGRPYELIGADAIQWMQAYRGEAYDLIVDDLYGEADGEASRAVSPERWWFEVMDRVLAPNGILVMNFLDRPALRQAAWFHERSLQRRYPQAWSLTTSRYENRVAAFLHRPSDARCLRKNLGAVPALDSRRTHCRLDFRLQRLQPA